MKILLYRSSSTIGKIIEYFSDGDYSHVAIMFDDMMVVEAQPFQKVRCFTMSKRELIKNDKVDVFEVEASKEQIEIIRDFLSRQIGKPYDYLAILGFVVHASIQGRKAYGKWICSELVFAALRKAGILLLNNVDAWRVSPHMIATSTLLKPFDKTSL